MGITGLNKFVDEHPELTREYELFEKRIVIDGSNFIYFLYTRSEADFVFGGDYRVFVNWILAYISCLRKCGVEPIVVFDGGLNKSKDMFEKRKKYFDRRLERVYKLVNEINSTDYIKNKDEEALLPINAYEVFKMVLYENNIKVVQCEFKEDHPIANLANEYKCPVLTKDTDFYIYDLKHGFIRLEDLNTSVQTNTDGKKYLKCKIYYIESFISRFNLKQKNVLPLFAALILYRKEHFQDSKSFFIKIGVRKNSERFQKLLEWLQQYTLEDALKTVLRMIREDKRDNAERFLRTHIDNYQLKSTNLKHIVENNINEIIKKSKISTNCGAKLPDNFILAFHEGLPSSFLTVLTQHCQFLSPLIEDFSLESSHSCSRHIRAATYGVLLQHENETHNNHSKNCLKIVEEFDRVQAIEGIKKIEVRYLTRLQSVNVPKLTDIYKMAKLDLRNFITAVLGVEEAFCKSFPESLQLFFCCVKYWFRNCVPKPDDSHITSLLLCVMYHQISSSRESAGEEILLFQNFPDAQLVLQNFERHLQMPSEKPYDFHIVYTYNQLQICLLETIQLNWLLGLPFVSPKLHETFCGTLLYNLARKMQSSEPSEMLGNLDVLVVWFKTTKERLENFLQN